MTPLVHAVWRARMAGLLWRHDVMHSPAAAWSASGGVFWRRFRDAGFMPRQALDILHGRRLP